MSLHVLAIWLGFVLGHHAPDELCWCPGSGAKGHLLRCCPANVAGHHHRCPACGLPWSWRGWRAAYLRQVAAGMTKP